MKITGEDIDMLCDGAIRDISEYLTTENEESSKEDIEKVKQLRIELKKITKGE